MSITSQSAGVGKPKVDRSASAIAQYNRRRYHGDFGAQPNAPSVGIKIDSGASESAVYASKANLGPKLWAPSPSKNAQRASTLASSSSSSYIPDAHFVNNPKTQVLASKAASSATSVGGEVYGARLVPDAYEWNRRSSDLAFQSASRSAAAALRDERKLTGVDALQKPPPEAPIDISKVLVAAQQNAHARLASADNHLPADFGVRTEEEKYQRRQQVLSLISVADQRVKARMAQLDQDANAQHQVFGSIEYQKLAMEIAARHGAQRMENHGKLDLGGGLYMSQDEIDDIARRHVQPVLDKVQLVAEKKRIADREAAERQAQIQQLQAEEREAAQREKAEAKRLAAEEKAKAKAQQAAAKAKAQRAAQRAKENPEPGSHLWHWQQVEIIKEDVKDAKQQREEALQRAKDLRDEHDRAQEDLAAIIERHRELKRDYFERGDKITEKSAEYDSDSPETASLFELKQRRETVKQSTKNAKVRRVELENTIERTDRQAKEADVEAEEAAKKHHELKIKYFQAREEAEEAEKKFQAEEEARLKREAEERAEREREAAAKRQRDAEAAAQRQRDSEAAGASKATEGTAAAGTAAAAGSSSAKPAAAAPPSSPPPAAKEKSKKKGKKQAEKPVETKNKDAELEEQLKNAKLPPKSKLISLGDARTGPVLAGYKVATTKPDHKNEASAAEGKPAESKPEESKPEESKTEESKAKESEESEVKAEESKIEEPKPEDEESKVEESKAEEEAKLESADKAEEQTEAAADTKLEDGADKAVEETKSAEAETGNSGLKLAEPEAADPESAAKETATEATPAEAEKVEEKAADSSATAGVTEPVETPSVEAAEEGAGKYDLSAHEDTLERASTNAVAPRSEQGSTSETIGDEARHAGDASAKELHEDTSLKEKSQSEFGLGNTAESSSAIAAAEKKPEEAAEEIPGVAGAVATGPVEDIDSNIPLGTSENGAKAKDEVKDAFSGFDSSNVKEVEEKAPGLFKEDIQ